MRISLERSGGLMGVPRVTTVDTKTLAANEAAQLHQLVEAAQLSQLPPQMTARGNQPDRFQYELILEDGGEPHRIAFSESAMPDSLRPLVDWLWQTGQHPG
jgi:hypothetical protein